MTRDETTSTVSAIKHISSGIVYQLAAVMDVGRDPKCELRLDNPLVSSIHGRLSWSGTQWEVRDFGSSNGTFVNHKPIPAGSQIPLKRRSRFAFGDPEDLFQLIDASAPTVSAQCDGLWVYGTANSLELPTEHGRRCAIDRDGDWFVLWFGSRDEKPRLVADRDELDVAGKRWRIYLPLVQARTRRPDDKLRRVADVTLRIQVSRDQERIDITYIHGDRAITVQPRAHAPLILYLAETRLEDATLGMSSAYDHGWRERTQVIEDVWGPKVLREEENRENAHSLLSLHIWRAKAQARDEADISDFRALIEIHPTSGHIRLGISCIEILR